MKTWNDFPDKYIVDFEFHGDDKDALPIPVCYVFKNLRTGEITQHWITKDETSPEYSLNDTSLFISFYSPAEMKCHLALNFDFPIYSLDLFPEFRCLTNGLRTPSGNSLIGACLYYGLSPTDAAYKESMRTRILQGPPYTDREKKSILDYCQKDVEMTAELFTAMQPHINLPYALLRGKYMGCVARMEANGIPLDVPKLNKLKDNWPLIKTKFIAEVDKKYNVFEGNVLKEELLRKYIAKNHIPCWGRT